MPRHRFFLSPDKWHEQGMVLTEEEAHHCRDVMRLGAGDVITVFDGQGREVDVAIQSSSKKGVAVEPCSTVKVSPEIPAKITLGQAIPKGKNMDLIIQKATELGVAKIVPILTTNTVVQLNDREIAKKQEKWQRVAIEACKQCGQNWLPEVALPQSVNLYINGETDPFRVIAAIDPQARSIKNILADCSERPNKVSLLIGPEGDFTKEEVEFAISAGFSPMSLGPIILRSETAAIYTISVFAYELMNRCGNCYSAISLPLLPND